MSTATSEEPDNRTACAACKHQRKKCKSNCVLAPFFPKEKHEEFQAIHKVFGVSNMTKMLSKIDVQDRGEAVKSFIWEANMWKDDPIHGPLGFFNKLEKELDLLKNHHHHQETRSSKQKQIIVPNENESGWIGFDQYCNNNGFSSSTKVEAANKNIVVPYNGNNNNNYYDSSNSENLELGPPVNSYISLLQGQEDCNIDGASASYANNIAVAQPIVLQKAAEQRIMVPIMVQGQSSQRMSQRRGNHANLYNYNTTLYQYCQGNGFIYGRGQAILNPSGGYSGHQLDPRGQAILNPSSFGREQHQTRAISQVGDDDHNNFYTPFHYGILQRMHEISRGQGIRDGDLTVQQHMQHTNGIISNMDSRSN